MLLFSVLLMLLPSLAGCGMLQAQSAPVQMTVDATGPIRNFSYPPTSGRSGSAGSPKLPLTIRLEIPDVRPDIDGKTVVEFVLTNVSKAAITVPVFPNPADVESGANAQYHVLSLGCRLTKGADDRSGDAPGISLWGRVSVAGSLVALEPGKSLLVRARLAIPRSWQRDDWASGSLEATAILEDSQMTVSNGRASSDSQVLGIVRSVVRH